MAAEIVFCIYPGDGFCDCLSTGPEYHIHHKTHIRMAYLGTNFFNVLPDIHIPVDCGLDMEERL